MTNNNGNNKNNLSPDTLLDSDPKALIKQVETTAIATWSENKKKEFSDLFENRIKAAQYILLSTASRIMETAASRRFIKSSLTSEYAAKVQQYIYSSTRGHNSPIGGRDINELNEIAETRAKAIISSLPPIQKAVEILNKDIADKMVLVEELKVKGQVLVDALDEVTEPISMAEQDQKMTLAEFRKLISEKEKKQLELLQKLKEIAEEGAALEQQIDKALFRGLPGLSEAIVSVAKTHVEKATALSTLSRRVTEQVMFGDNESAAALLKTFENDEVEVSTTIKKQFSEALEKLKLSVKGKAAKKGK